MRPLALLLLALLAIGACAARAFPPRPVAEEPYEPERAPLNACILVATSRLTDSLYVWGYDGPCLAGMPDSVAAWRIPSRHRLCDVRFVIDGPSGRMTVQWGNCPPPDKRSEG